MNILPVGAEHKSLLADISQQTFVDTFASYNIPEDMQLFLETQFTREQLMAEPDIPDNYFFYCVAGTGTIGLHAPAVLGKGPVYMSARWSLS